MENTDNQRYISTVLSALTLWKSINIRVGKNFTVDNYDFSRKSTIRKTIQIVKRFFYFFLENQISFRLASIVQSLFWKTKEGRKNCINPVRILRSLFYAGTIINTTTTFIQKSTITHHLDPIQKHYVLIRLPVSAHTDLHYLLNTFYQNHLANITQHWLINVYYINLVRHATRWLMNANKKHSSWNKTVLAAVLLPRSPVQKRNSITAQVSAEL